MWGIKYAEYLADRSQIPEPASGNPFSDRVRIEDPTRFFGRTEFLRRLQEDLQKGMSLALVGETQIGKSSILQYLYRQGKHQWGGKPSKFVYMDMQLIDRDEDFQSALCHHFGIETNCNMFQLDRELKRRGQKYILCLDEVEMLSHEMFSFKARANLCGLANGDSAPLILITATRSPLNIIFPDRPNETSPLASLCQQRDVLPFDEQETIDFIHMRLEQTGIKFSDRNIAEIYQQTNGHPGKVQQMASELFDRLASALPNRSTTPQAT
jgi:type II secretory pathway predicted ATPase ExeA